jgi:hypothetical protein
VDVSMMNAVRHKLQPLVSTQIRRAGIAGPDTVIAVRRKPTLSRRAIDMGSTVWYSIKDSRYGHPGDFIMVGGLPSYDVAVKVAENFKDELLFILGADVDVEVWVE